MNITEFGKQVLNYIENTTNEGDVILLSINEKIYEQEIFHGNTASKEEFEIKIKNFVNLNGLDYTKTHPSRDKDYYAIALAAHQIILGYKCNDEGKAINDALLEFYYPDQYNSNILYSNYYGNDQWDRNYQELLWSRVKSILKEKLNRKLIIPIIDNNGNRDQKFIKAQLCLFRNLQDYFYCVFYRNAFSFEHQYSKQEFINRIKKVNQNGNNIVKNKIVDSLWNKIRLYSQDDFGSLNLDENLIFELLWTIYISWDGSLPREWLSKSNDYLDNPIYVELNEDKSTFTTESGKFFRTMLMSEDNREGNFRLFSYIGDDVWEAKDSTINDLPESDVFVILIYISDKRLFSKKCMLEYQPSEELLHKEPDLKNYIILKYFSLPSDFYAKLHYTEENNNVGLKLLGGVRLFGKTYLNLQDERLNPSVFEGGSRIKKIPKTITINDVKIEEYKSHNSNTIRLHLYNPMDNRSLDEYSILYSNMPKLKFCNEEEKLLQEEIKNVDITTYKYRAELKGLINKGGFIPNSRVKVFTNRGYVNIKDFEEFSTYNKSQLTNIQFGWFGNDDELFSPSESIYDRLKIVKTLDFKIRLVKGEPAISDFWVVELNGYDVKDYFGDDNYSKENEIARSEHYNDKTISIQPLPQLNYIDVITSGDDYIQHFNKPIYFDEIKAYQKALCVWLCHRGTADYQDIKNICRIMVQKTEFADLQIYGESPEYIIFTPLFKIGIIIPLIKDKKTFFTVIDKYEDVMNGKELKAEKKLTKHFVNLSAFLLMQGLFSTSSISTQQVFIRYSKLSWSWQSNKLPARNLIYPCIYKCDYEPWRPVYFGHNNNHYLINRDNPDSYSVCKSIINREHYYSFKNTRSAFEYYPKQKILVCRYFSDIPSLYARLLMQTNPKKYSEGAVYLSGTKNFREQHFENIDYEFVKELDNRLSQ